MALALAILIAFTGLVFAWGLAEHVARRRFRRASEALNQRTRIGL